MKTTTRLYYVHAELATYIMSIFEVSPHHSRSERPYYVLSGLSVARTYYFVMGV